MTDRIARLVQALEGDYIVLGEIVDQLHLAGYDDFAVDVEKDPKYWTNARVVSRLRDEGR